MVDFTKVAVKEVRDAGKDPLITSRHDFRRLVPLIDCKLDAITLDVETTTRAEPRVPL